MARDYRKIIAWQRGHDLTLLVYKHSKSFPREELLGLTSQVRRAAYSTPTNIVEGASRESKKDYLRFLYIARASLNEAEYLIRLAHDLGYLNDEQHRQLNRSVKHTHAPLHGLIETVERQVGRLGTVLAIICSGAAILLARCLTGTAMA